MAVMHFDGDAFFTSVEQAVHPSLRNRPLVTGKERGIIACASYEAKALGIRRGVSLHEARKRCPGLVVLPSDYETYSLFSKRMFEIARRYTPMVEEYSIDEGFADLAGLRRVFHMSYAGIAQQFQQAIQRELGLTVSVGLSLSKSLAKRASKYRKPKGFTAVSGRYIHLLLERTPLEQVWGFGPNTVELLRKSGLHTALDYVQQPRAWAQEKMGKTGVELWRELRGESVYPVEVEEKSSFASISKCKTFSTPSADRDFVYAKLVRNLESACIKMRRHHLCTRDVVAVLRQQDYEKEAGACRLNRCTSATGELLPAIRHIFENLFCPGKTYRATMVVLRGLKTEGASQLDLFEDHIAVERLNEAAKVMDRVNSVYGKHALSLGPSLYLPGHRITERDDLPWRKEALLKGEGERRRIGIPRLDIQV